MSTVKIVLSDREVIAVLNKSVDIDDWLKRESLTLMSHIEIERNYVSVFVRHEDGGAVHKIKFVTMDVES